MMGGEGRWFRVNTTWSQSEWLAVLPPAQRLAWIELLGHVKAHGFDGRVRSVSPAVFGRMVGIDAADIEGLIEAAATDGALEITEGAWVITGWRKKQGPPRPSAEAWAALRLEVFERDDFTCRYCGQRGGRLECDHIIPVARSGSHDPSNLVVACFTCNRSKRDKLVSEWKGAP